MHTGKCPHCQKVMTNVILEPINIAQPYGGTTWLGVSMQCPYCRTVISVGIDPIALKTDTINQLVKALRNK